MKTRFFRAACSALILGSLAGVAPALADEHDKAGKKGSDHQFAVKAAQGSLAEIELGKLASEKAANPEVKQFGQQMVTDHSQASDELKAAAAKSNITLPTDPGAAHRAQITRLSKLSGEAFDREYMQLMVKEHKKDVAEFRKQASNGSDPNLKSFAQSKVPALEKHLEQAQQLAGSHSADRSRNPK